MAPAADGLPECEWHVLGAFSSLQHRCHFWQQWHLTITASQVPLLPKVLSGTSHSQLPPSALRAGRQISGTCESVSDATFAKSGTPPVPDRCHLVPTAARDTPVYLQDKTKSPPPPFVPVLHRDPHTTHGHIHEVSTVFPVKKITHPVSQHSQLPDQFTGLGN